MGQCFEVDCNHQAMRESCKFFRFPKDIDKAHVGWKEAALRRTDRQYDMNMDRLCSCHFKDGDKKNGPTIFGQHIKKKVRDLNQKKVKTTLPPALPAATATPPSSRLQHPTTSTANRLPPKPMVISIDVCDATLSTRERETESLRDKTMRRNQTNRSYPASKWKQARGDTFITLNLECYEEPLTYSQFQAAKAAKAEYTKNQQVIAAAKEGRLIFLSDGKTKILDKPFSEIPEIQQLGQYKPPPPRPQQLPAPHIVTLPCSPVTPNTIYPNNSMGRAATPSENKSRRKAPISGRDSPDIIFVGETPPMLYSPPPPLTPQTSQVAKKKTTAQKDSTYRLPITITKPSFSSSDSDSDCLPILFESPTVDLNNYYVEDDVPDRFVNIQPKGPLPSPKLQSEPTSKKGSKKSQSATSISSSSASDSGSSAIQNWVPLDEYYYGKTEGNPAYTEQKGEFRFKCFYCMKMLYNNVAAMLHIQGHIDTEKQVNLDISDLTQCKHCFKQFDTPFEMQTHIERVHMNKANVLLCRICEKDHHSRGLLTDHMRKSHNACEMPYVCQLCNFRSSMYSDVVDHFKKKHCSSQHLLCLYCLRVFTTRIVSQGYGVTNVFYNHLLKHQMKNSTKKCHYCKLIYLNTADLKEHRKRDHMPNQKGAIGASTSKHNSAPDQVMIKVATETRDSNSKLGVGANSGGGIKSLNVPTIKKVVEQKIIFSVKSIFKAECVECGNLYEKVDHFSKYIQCSLCRFATSCSFAYANHMLSFHSGQQTTLTAMRCAIERQLSEVMYCMCGFSSHYGNIIATHLVSCSKTFCSTEQPPPSQNVPLDEFGRRMKDPRKKPGASLLDVLGLVKKDSIQSSSRVVRRESPSPPPVDMPEVSVSDPPPRRPSLLRDSLKKPSFKAILGDGKQFVPDSKSSVEQKELPCPDVTTDASAKQGLEEISLSMKREAEDEPVVGKAKRVKLSAKVVLSDDGSSIEDGTKDEQSDATKNKTSAEKEKTDKNKSGSESHVPALAGGFGGVVLMDEVEGKEEEVGEKLSDDVVMGDDDGTGTGERVKGLTGERKEVERNNDAGGEIKSDDSDKEGGEKISEDKGEQMSDKIEEVTMEEEQKIGGGKEKKMEDGEKSDESKEATVEDEQEIGGGKEEKMEDGEKSDESKEATVEDEQKIGGGKEEKMEDGEKSDESKEATVEDEQKVSEEKLEDGEKSDESKDKMEDGKESMNEETMGSEVVDVNTEKENEKDDDDIDDLELGSDTEDDLEKESKEEENAEEEEKKEAPEDGEEEERRVDDGVKESEEGMNEKSDGKEEDNEDDLIDEKEAEVMMEDGDDNGKGDDDNQEDVKEDEQIDDDGIDDKKMEEPNGNVEIENKESIGKDTETEDLVDDKGNNEKSNEEKPATDGGGGEKLSDDGNEKNNEFIDERENKTDEEKVVDGDEDDTCKDVGQSNSDDAELEDRDNDDKDLVEEEDVNKDVKKDDENEAVGENKDNDNPENETMEKQIEGLDENKSDVGNKGHCGDGEDKAEETISHSSPAAASEICSGHDAGTKETQISEEFKGSGEGGRVEEGQEERKRMEEEEEGKEHSGSVDVSNSSSSVSVAVTVSQTPSSTQQFDPSAIDAIGAVASSSSSTSLLSSPDKASRETTGDYSRSRDRSRSRDQEKDRDKEKYRDRERDRERDRYRDRERDHYRDRDRYYDRNDRDRHRDDNRRRDRDRDRDRHRDYDYDYDRNRDRDRHRDRDRQRDYYKHRDDRHYYR